MKLLLIRKEVAKELIKDPKIGKRCDEAPSLSRAFKILLEEARVRQISSGSKK